MKPLVLLLTMWGADAPPMVYVMGGNLTPGACTAGMANLDYMATLVGGSVSCEFDLAKPHDSPDAPLVRFPACEYEDSINCMWNAQERGNGIGQSFFNVYGDVLPVDWNNESQ